jgi:cobalt/nickel transport protein
MRSRLFGSPASPKHKLGWFIGAGLLVALILAGVVSNFASGSPDGLDATTRQGCEFNEDDEIVGGECLAQEAQDHELADSPFADYGIAGIDNPFLSTAVAGVLGVLVTFLVGTGLFWLVRRRGAGGAKGSETAGTDEKSPVGTG